jgi:hypothetical protein
VEETKKTVVMRKGDLYADVFDSPETISQAQKEGYHLCSEAELTVREEDRERHRRGRKPKAETEAPIEQLPPEAPPEVPPEAPSEKKKHGIFGG